MKTILGILIIIGGIFLGLYVGLWLMFIGGIVQIVDTIKATPVEAMGIALGTCRIVFASFVGAASFWICAVLGAGVLSLPTKRKR